MYVNQSKFTHWTILRKNIKEGHGLYTTTHHLNNALIVCRAIYSDVLLKKSKFNLSVSFMKQWQYLAFKTLHYYLDNKRMCYNNHEWNSNQNQHTGCRRASTCHAVCSSVLPPNRRPVLPLPRGALTWPFPHPPCGSADSSQCTTQWTLLYELKHLNLMCFVKTKTVTEH